MLSRRHPCLLGLLVLVLSLSHDRLLFAKTVTRYIDDSYGDPVTGSKPEYFPAQIPPGQQVWKDQNCRSEQGCLIVHDTSRTWNQTYTAATYEEVMGNMGFRLRFQGTGIAVYFILANNEDNTATLTECNFLLDGTLRKAYNHTPQVGAGTEYDVEVYKEEGLENRDHVVSVETGSKNKTYNIYIAFDYATYTTEVSDEEKPSPSASAFDVAGQASSRPPTGAIVGGAVGGAVLTAGAIVGFFFLRRNWRRSRAAQGSKVIALNSFDESDDSQQARALPTRPLLDDGSREVSELREQMRQLQERLGSFQPRSDVPPPEYSG
ncbi:hypothetical protein V5O48_007085 [Marasmius crinis-equi]|uniref:Uncharacterized protein n=1 Tax=Marasmius crinis-equi TaxID=585013 RepID=A0ABR3FHR3_9AGAR